MMTHETIEPLAKNPFGKAAVEYVDKLHLILDEIIKSEYEAVLARDEDRIADAISKAETSRRYDPLEGPALYERGRERVEEVDELETVRPG